MWTDEDNADLYRNPCETSFEDWKKEMTEISEGVFKKVVVAGDESKAVDLKRTRVTYHRNMYQQDEDHPFDSTYLNGKTDEVCLPINPGNYLEGFLEALATMHQGEQSMFIISYKKMFKELGCGLRVCQSQCYVVELVIY